MKLNKVLIGASLLVTCLSYGQTGIDTSDQMMNIDSTASIELLENSDDYIPEEVAPAAEYDNYSDYNPFNTFKYNKKIKEVEKPDKQAVYSQGIFELLKQISNNLIVPYGYASTDQYVVLQFIVGKDSSLYNPEILFSPGTEYSINATEVIEKLPQQFLPANKNGKPADSIITIPIRFNRKTNHEYR